MTKTYPPEALTSTTEKRMLNNNHKSDHKKAPINGMRPNRFVSTRLLGSVLTPQTSWKGAALADGLTTQGVASDGTMTATPERLTIESKVGSFCFKPQDIASIHPAGALPWLGAGIFVRHRIEGYPEEIGFCPRSTSSEEVLQVLASYGYEVA